MSDSSQHEEQIECPLCMEPLDVDDLSFYPCSCGYQICRFCWHRIRTDENELCPACRKAYSENPADFTPLSQEQIVALKAEKRQKDQQKKQKINEDRKHLANVRVVQKNLVFVVGLPPRLADPEVLKRHEYFGKYGKIHKVVINPSTAYAGAQGPSASAYVTYVNNNDSLRAIQSVNNITIDGRLIKTSLGTTKYCSNFMKNQPCPKSDCMYLHELGDEEASFTKEEMHQGKHQEYEKKLHDTLIAQTQNEDLKNLTNNKQNKQTKRTKETWPSLTISPGPKATLKQVNTKETTKAEFKNKNDRSKNEKNKIYFEDEEVPNDADYIWSNVTDEGHEKALFDAPKLEETNFLSKEDTYLNDANVLQSKFCTAEKQEDIPSEESALKNRLSTKLPDLLNGTEIDRYYFNTSGEREIASNKIEPQPDWEDSLRHLMSKSNADDCTKQLRKSDELFAFNNLTLNDILMDNRNALFSDQYQPTNELKHNCTSNMLKFFDFHKNLQNQHNFQKGNMGAAEHSYSLMNEGLKSDSNTCRPTNFQQEAQFSVNKSTPKNTYVGSVYHLQNASVADELGFDPFVETQKALAELMRDELTRKTLEDPDNTKKRFSTVHAPPGFNTVNNCKINSWSNNSHPQNGQNILNTSKSSGVTNYKDWTCLDPAIVSFRQFPNYGPLPENTDARQHFQPFTDNFMQYSSLGGNSSFGLDQSQYGLNGIRNVQTQMTSNTLNWFSHNQSNFQPNSISYPPGFHSSLNGNKMN